MLNNKYKTVMCKYSESKKPCPLGIKCHYAHNKEELRSLNDPLPDNTPFILNKMPDKENIGEELNPAIYNNYKSEICKFWEHGKCKYQQYCSYAHGNNEIINQDLNNSNGNEVNQDPLKDPNMEFILRRFQLLIINKKINENYPENENAKEIFNRVDDLLNKNQINVTADILMKFLYSLELNEEDRQINKRIIKESVIFGKEFLKFLKSNEFIEMIKEYEKKINN